MTDKLEVGQVLDISETFKVIPDKAGYIVTCTVENLVLPIGRILNEDLTWFPNTASPEIKKIVYLGDNLYGVKHLTSPYLEFNTLSETMKENILTGLYNAVKDLPDFNEWMFLGV
jgi:hypothetical protein